MVITSRLFVNELINDINQEHAAVFVGSGFSKNADPVYGDLKKSMPNWFELADVFCEKLGIDVHRDATTNTARYLDPLTLAEEVETLYGRPFLDELLIQQICDDWYKPSELHTKLLTLPWTDVFTTNYDSLLERTQSTLPNKKYRVVVDQNDLLHSKGNGQSRIIKLHGSFPSSRPFIITQEDFRKYPKDHASLVNTVQQSLLENTFCLIGFSGDDPNFLKWIGWIHDNLGINNSPKIYMVVNEAGEYIKAKTLASKNIELIVLQELYSSQFPDGELSYREALNRFLSELVEANDDYAKRRSTINWPDIRKIERYKSGHEKEFLAFLRKQHLTYPGYIVAPYSRHKYVNAIIEAFDGFLLEANKEKKCEVEIVNEYCWLHSIICRPLFYNDIQSIQTIINRHHDDKSTLLRSIRFALLSSCRMQYLREQWEKLYDELSSELSNVEPDGVIDSGRLAYENVMFHLYSLEFSQINNLVDSIKTGNDYPELSLKKAGILGIVGRFEEAENLLLETLAYIRRHISYNHQDSARFESLESCMVSLYNHVKQAHSASVGEFWIDEEREHKLLNANFEDVYVWNSENNRFIGQLSNDYIDVGPVKEKSSFDIGRKMITHSFYNDMPALIAYGFIGFREATGHPFRIGNVTDKDGVLGAALRIKRYGCELPVLLLLLSGESEISDHILNRAMMSFYTADELDNLFKHCIDALHISIMFESAGKQKHLFYRDLYRYTMQEIPEILSRLATRISSGQYELLLDIILNLYGEQKTGHMINVTNLVRRTIESMPFQLLVEKMPYFWRYPLHVNGKRGLAEFPDPFQLIYRRMDSQEGEELIKLSMNEHETEVYSSYFELLKAEKQDMSVINRILFIALIYEINDEFREKIKRVLWDKENLDKYGLPQMGVFYDVAVIDFPHDKEDSELINILWNKIQDEFSEIAKDNSLSDYREKVKRCCTIVFERGVSETEAKKMEKLIASCSLKCEKYLKDDIMFGGVNAKNNLIDMGNLAGILLISSKLSNMNRTYSDDSVQLIKEVLQRNQIPNALLTWCTDTLNRKHVLYKAIFSGNEERENDAVTALSVFVKYDLTVESNLQEMLIYALATSNSYCVNSIVLALENLIVYNRCNESECNMIADALTKYDELTRSGKDDLDNTVGEKTTVRFLVSRLAAKLYKWFSKNGKSIPDGVKYWKEISESPTEFAEIKNCWSFGK